LLEPTAPNAFSMAREALHAALELTIPGDPGWEHEREQLLLVEVDLLAAHADARQALMLLD
jgi:hypothetical protein